MNNITTENKGTIKLGETVMVSDPCYGLNTWCQGVLKNVLPGQYDCNVEYSDEGDWGIRVSAIEATHIGYDRCVLSEELEDFVVGVDSGLAGIFDYEYYAKYHMGATERPHVDDDWYDKVCDLAHKSHFDGNTIDNLGLVSSSGYGDGGYDCWTSKNEDGKIVSIRVEFLSEYDEEE